MDRSNSLATAFFGLAACLLVANNASAQPALPSASLANIPLDRYLLATLPEVQNELKLTDAQKKAVTDAVAKIKEAQDKIPQLQMATLQGGQAAIEKAVKERGEIIGKVAALKVEQSDKIVALLNEDQKNRLNSLFVQANSVSYVIRDAATSKSLGISKDQIKKFDEASTSIVGRLRGGGQAAFANLAPELEAAAIKIFTDDQKKKFEELKGKELKMDVSSLRNAYMGALRGAK